jgi:translation initiation factor IF-1
MARQGVELEGVVTETLRGGQFRVMIHQGQAEIEAICTIGGKMKTKAPNLRVLLGDRVRVLLDELTMKVGRIEWVIRNR